MFDKRLYSIFGFIFGSKKVLRDQIIDVVDTNVKSREDELRVEIETFVSNIEAALSKVKAQNVTRKKVIVDSSGYIGWGEDSFPYNDSNRG
jgi:3-dehydroquinate dehydratase